MHAHLPVTPRESTQHMCIDLHRRSLLAATAAAAVTRPCSSWAAGEDIVVAQIAPFTGLPAPDAPELNQGIKAAFGQINAAGGINGRQLTLFELDDGYKEDRFVQQFFKAMQRRPVALLAPVGSRAVKRMLDDKLLDQNDVVVLNAIPGAESLRSPGHPRLFHIRAGDRQQVERIIRHAVALGNMQMVVLYQDAPIGTSGLAVAQNIADSLGVKLSCFSFTADPATLTEAANRAAASQGQCALVLGGPRFAADGIVALRKAGLGTLVYALGYVPPTLIKSLTHGGARGVALTQIYPNPNGTTLAVQHAFQAAMKHAGSTAPYSAFHFEGYITARVLAEGLRRTRELSTTGLARALRTMNEHDLGGYRVNFAKGNVGSSFVDIAVINGDGRLVY
jgi:branched-chain amino acid transport system substrate-binding protein